jgi:hypothetical protein
MGMTGGGRAGASRNVFQRVRVGLLVAGLCGLSAAGCTIAPQGATPVAMVRGPTVAFESIDGPPESIFRQLVQDLNDEATARQVAVVSRDAPAQFRVRGYVAALVEKRRHTVIAWVWDVYDAEQRRAIRLTGEEPAGGAGRGTWAAADDALLRRIARSGIDRLAAFLATPRTEPPAIPQERGPVVAAGDDVAPDSDRISRIVTAATGARAEEASPGAGAPPEPSPRPTGAAATLAFSSNDR